MRLRHLLAATAATAAIIAAAPATAAISFAGALEVSGAATDLSGLSGVNGNRLSFGSDLDYDFGTGLFYGISDRGPGGGTIDWAPRVEAFSLNVGGSGAISNFQLQQTTVFKQKNGQVYSGLFPDRLPGGNVNTLGNALDSEGIVHLSNGHFLVSDEYGPSIYETDQNGRFIRAFTQPQNVIPKAAGTPDYVSGRPTLTTGRQDNRGYEGLTISGDGKTAWAILQDPLVNEGSQGDGRRSQNLRIVRFDVATGQATGQFVYQLESIAAINGRIPGTADDFSATNQGRSIGVSSITWIGDNRFLVIERDNRGQGPDNIIAGQLPSGTKRVYLVDLNGATDVSNTSLAGSNSLPGGVVAATKTLFIDVQASLLAAGLTLPEKLEGLTIGPRLAGGGFTLILATDNDFSVTQNGSNVQFDVCTGGAQIALGGACPEGQTLVPSRLYSFAITGADAALFASSLFAVPEPATWALMIGGFGMTGAAMRRRRALAA